jgi:hypothetical protein
MDHKLTVLSSIHTGSRLPQAIGPLKTVGALRKALKNWPSSMPLDKPVHVATYNVGFQSECLGLEVEEVSF